MEIRVENKRTSKNVNRGTVGYSKIVGLQEFLKIIEILLCPVIQSGKTFHNFGQKK